MVACRACACLVTTTIVAVEGHFNPNLVPMMSGRKCCKLRPGLARAKGHNVWQSSASAHLPCKSQSTSGAPLKMEKQTPQTPVTN
eukprot:1240566-Amphidinium_carterae.1